ncbi:brain tumor protein isoform X2 [Bacillus rossius redtenbacheri]|uniref:brain tumor protein isoform X2 n=1 Tax=Bacillus rossius redtenbacheri TaxID=93214 RepID=UPI002FDD2BF9
MEIGGNGDAKSSLFRDAFRSSNSGSLEESGPSHEQDQICDICSDKLCKPRVLSCLHVFCEACLDHLGPLVDEAGDTCKEGQLECPTCKQETKVGCKGASSLPCDYVLTNLLDMCAIESTAVLCTSCKAKEQAVARCSDCAHFLCPNCNTAHQFMRCFENHHVVSFDELKSSLEAVPIHKPIFCESHPTETIAFYCVTCQVPICKDCLGQGHAGPDHRHERLGEAEGRQREELAALAAESRAKLGHCEEASGRLEGCLGELQAQHDAARDLVHETFHSCKAVLERCRDAALERLQQLHSARELRVMDTLDSLEKTMEKITDACKFTSRLLEHGSPPEVLSLKKMVGAQLLYLINNTPKSEVSTTIEFVTDIEKFEAAVKATFGSFKADASVTPKEAPPSPPPPPAAPVFSGLLGPPEPPPPALRGLTSIQEYNLQQLASLAEKEAVAAPRRDPGPGSGPPTPSFSLVDLFSGDHAMNNLQALAKLGGVALDTQGQIVASGASPMGLAVSGSSSAVARPVTTPPPPPPPQVLPQTLGALLNDLATGVLNGGADVLGRGPSPSLSISTTIASLNGGTAFSTLSGTPSPILSQPDELDPLPPALALNGGGVGGPAPSGFQLMRSTSGKATPMQIRYKYGQLGPGKGQFNSPHGFCLGAEEDIIVADTNNHRIQTFEKTGTFKFQFGIPGKEEGQLWYPRKVAVMRNSGKFVVCDRGNERSRMQIFTKSGHFIKKIAIRYIDIVAGLAVTAQGHIVAVDSVSPTVFVISEVGDLLRWFDCSDYMREPSDIAISGKEFYVCDFKGHCVVVFSEEGLFLRRIGGENITNFPNGIDISDAGDVLVGDSHGNRFHVAVFSRDGTILCEFECPYVKLSKSNLRKKLASDAAVVFQN